MIIVEGPDGAGKTTLCKRLAENFKLTVFDWEFEMGLSRDEMKVHPVRRYYTAFQREFQMHGDRLALPYIHDRFYFSSLVYGPLMEGTNQMTDEDRKTIARLIVALACPIICCLPPKEVVVQNVRGEGHQMDGVKEAVGDIYDMYTEVMGQDYPFVMYYDYTNTRPEPNFFDYDSLLSRIGHYLERRSKRGLNVDRSNPHAKGPSGVGK